MSFPVVGSPAMVLDPNLSLADALVLQNLFGGDISAGKVLTTSQEKSRIDSVVNSRRVSEDEAESDDDDVVKLIETNGKKEVVNIASSDVTTMKALDALNNPKSEGFEPTVFVTWDLQDLKPWIRSALSPYIRYAQTVVRHPTDVVMLTHLILYFTTSVLSALYLYHHFTYVHGLLHWLMQSWYVGTFTLMRHQHIHGGGILKKSIPYSLIDLVYPYILDPLHGHTWNSYFYHHVKHHHVEGNGPDDLSSTIRYQRDDVWHFLHYVGRFLFLVWLDLPLYFIRKGRYSVAFRAWAWDTANYSLIVVLARWQLKPTIFVLVLPFIMIRLGLMVGNWGQHALVDEVEPDSDFRSSITLVDVASNRFCFNDGYHTSHHLNPLRHWREHPNSFITQKQRYSDEHALVFHNIDYIMITVRLLMKDYDTLAKCLIPIGSQVNLSMQERAAMLRRKTRAFTEEEIRQKFGSQKAK